MKGSAFLLVVAAAALVGCTDQKPRQEVTAPKAPQTVKPVIASQSTVCRAYTSHLARLQAALQAAPSDQALKQQVDDFQVSVDETCN